jgi:acid phosphatase
MALLCLLLAACNPLQTISAQPTPPTSPVKTQGTLPRPAHVVIVMEENHSYSDIIGASAAPYINKLAAQGALFTNSHAITHPSQPNYLALFSGSTQNITSDSCPNTYSGQNLASALSQAGSSFTGYSESMPAPGYTGCYYPATTELYARKHNPWANFSNVPTSSNQPLTGFPTDYSKLPTVSFVVPNQLNDMHSGSIAQGDSWLQTHLDSYTRWAMTHHSLLIVTWDEDDGSSVNQIPTIFVGQMVKTGHYNENINHYNVLRTVEDMYHLSYANASANVPPILDVWH